MPDCARVGCDREAKVRGLCMMHYQALLRSAGYNWRHTPTYPAPHVSRPLGPASESDTTAEPSVTVPTSAAAIERDGGRSI
jgi:hypothetical protein